MLTNVLTYLKDRRRASVRDVAVGLDVNEHAVDGMLQTLVRMGLARHLGSDAICSGGCSACPPEQLSLYEWKDESIIARQAPERGCSIKISLGR